MKKTFRFIFSAFIGITVLMMASCDKTAAVKEAAEKAAQSCPIKLGPVGEATAFSTDNEALVCEITPDSAFISNDSFDKSLVARFLAVELQRNVPELFSKVIESEMGLKGIVKLASGDVETMVGADELAAFSKQLLGASGNYASILLPIFNQYLNSQGAKEIGKGLLFKKVQVKGSQVQVMVDVDEEQVKFDDLKRELYAIKDDGPKKVEYVKDFVGMALPLIEQMNYQLVYRFKTKSDNETYMEIEPEEIKAYLNQ